MPIRRIHVPAPVEVKTLDGKPVVARETGQEIEPIDHRTVVVKMLEDKAFNDGTRAGRRAAEAIERAVYAATDYYDLAEEDWQRLDTAAEHGAGYTGLLLRRVGVHLDAIHDAKEPAAKAEPRAPTQDQAKVEAPANGAAQS